jgi:hypothetical protein
MTIKIKEPVNNDFSKKVNDQRTPRKIPISKDNFKKLKLLSLEQNISLYELVDNGINAMISSGKKTSSKYKELNTQNFAINTLTLTKAKKYCLENDIKIKDFLYFCLISILKK